MTRLTEDYDHDDYRYDALYPEGREAAPVTDTVSAFQPSMFHAPSPAKASNPKDLIGSDKLPLDLVPDTVTAYLALGFLEGVLKYGKVNWRQCGVRASIYIAANRRHMAKWIGGEEVDPVTKVPHLASAMACIGIIVDAQAAGMLVDDRPLRGCDTSAFIDGLTDTVKHLKALFADKDPVHYLIGGPSK
jgi:hypothetical protein